MSVTGNVTNIPQITGNLSAGNGKTGAVVDGILERIEDAGDEQLERISAAGDAEVERVDTLLDDLTATAETLPAGSNATVTYEDGSFAFGIPRGEKGEKGDPGVSGEPWELIADVTTTEDLETLDILTDTSGDAFALSKMYTQVFAPPPTTGATNFIKGSTWCERPNQGVVQDTLPTVQWRSGTSDGYFEYYHELICGLIRTEARAALSAVNTQNLTSNTGNFLDVTSINGIRLQQYNSTSSPIPSGTRVKVYGQRIIGT